MVDIDIKTDETSDFIIKTFTLHFSEASTSFLEKVFEKIQDLFEGRYPGYQQSVYLTSPTLVPVVNALDSCNLAITIPWLSLLGTVGQRHTHTHTHLI